MKCFFSFNPLSRQKASCCRETISCLLGSKTHILPSNVSNLLYESDSPTMADTTETPSYESFKLSYPHPYVALVEINRPEKLNAFLEPYALISTSSLPTTQANDPNSQHVARALGHLHLPFQLPHNPRHNPLLHLPSRLHNRSRHFPRP